MSRYNRRRERLLASYDQAQFEATQRERFAALGLDHAAAKARIDEIMRAHPELRGKHESEHHVVFAALGAQRRIRRILEVGTLQARTASLLALLFPDAEIHTMDLPDEDRWRIYSSTPVDVRTAYARDRDELLAQHANVRFLKENSLTLSLLPAADYDLVWVDGAHSYPIAGIDIANGLRLTAPDGVLAVDDALHDPPRGPGENEAGGTLDRLEEAGLVRVSYVYKRIDAAGNADPSRRKLVAIAERTASTSDTEIGKVLGA